MIGFTGHMDEFERSFKKRSAYANNEACISAKTDACCQLRCQFYRFLIGIYFNYDPGSDAFSELGGPGIALGIDAVFDTVYEYIGAANIEDDITSVVIKI